MPTRRFSIEAVFKGVDKVSMPVSRMQNAINKFTRKSKKRLQSLNKTSGNIGKKMKSGFIAGAAGLAIFGAALTNVIMTGAEFEQNIINAAAKFPGEIKKGTEAFKELENAALEVGKTTEFTASDSAQALDFLAMAGFNAKQSVSLLPSVVNLATASNLGLAEATDIASDSLGAFNLMTKDSAQLGKNLARVNDVMAKTTTSANTTMEALFETFKDAGPVGTTAGASIETVAALAGELANAGIKGQTAGTTLKNMFLSLAAQTPKAAKALKSIGVSTKDSQGNLRDIVDVIGDMNTGLKDMGTAEKSEVLKDIFGKIPIAGVNVLLNSGADRLKAYRKELENADGAADRLATTMRDSTLNNLKSLGSAVEGVKLSIFNTTKGPLNDVIKRTTEWVRANEKLIASNIGNFLADIFNNFETIVVWLKRIAIAIAVFGTFAILIKSLIAVMTVFNLVMAANPIVLMAMAVIFLTGTLVTLLLLWDDLNETVRAWTVVLGIAMGPIGWLILAGASVARNWEDVVTVFTSLWGMIRNVGEAIGALFSGKGIDAAVKELRQALDFKDTFFKAQGSILNRITGDLGFGKFFKGLDALEKKDEGVFTGFEAPEASGFPEFSPVVSPEERLSRSIEEKTSKDTLIIQDQTGRAEPEKGTFNSDNIILQPSGGF